MVTEFTLVQVHQIWNTIPIFPHLKHKGEVLGWIMASLAGTRYQQEETL